MKIRNGFVSNSSSSSFIILLPDNFDIESIDFNAELEKDCYECDAESVKGAMEQFIKSKYLYAEEIGYDEYNVVEQILEDYIIGSFDTGPDGGGMLLADKKKIKKILGL